MLKDALLFAGARFRANPHVDYDADKASDESALSGFEPTKTVQAGAEEHDINFIVKRFEKTGLLPQRVMPPLDQDFSDNAFDFRTAMDLIVQAERSFDSLPAETRKRFNNDPGEFVEFCSKSDNVDELRKMGLAVVPAKVVEVPPMKVEVVNPVPPPSK